MAALLGYSRRHCPFFKQGMRTGDIANLRQDHPHGGLGHGAGVATGRVQHADAPLRGARHVDVLRPAPQHADHFQRRGRLDESPANRRELRDQKIHVVDVPLQFVGQLDRGRAVLFDRQIRLLQLDQRLVFPPPHLDLDAQRLERPKPLSHHGKGNVAVADGQQFHAASPDDQARFSAISSRIFSATTSADALLDWPEQIRRAADLRASARRQPASVRGPWRCGNRRRCSICRCRCEPTAGSDRPEFPIRRAAPRGPC